jgi:hypothetical protein
MAATRGSLLDHLTALFVALDGEIVAVTVWVSPALRVGM